MKSKKHSGKTPVDTVSLKVRFSSPTESSESGNSSSQPESASQNNKQSSIGEMVSKENVLRAEVRWVLKTVESKYTQRSCDGLNELFKEMFPDSTIAKKFQLSRTKCSYITNHGLAPYFKSLLMNNIQSLHILQFLLMRV